MGPGPIYSLNASFNSTIDCDPANFFKAEMVFFLAEVTLRFRFSLMVLHIRLFPKTYVLPIIHNGFGDASFEMER